MKFPKIYNVMYKKFRKKGHVRALVFRVWYQAEYWRVEALTAMKKKVKIAE